jgi:hypothetical protein
LQRQRVFAGLVRFGEKQADTGVFKEMLGM